jgi:AraC-like DNA-binding protein
MLPHVWLNEDSSQSASSISLFFEKECLGADFFDFLPNKDLKRLLKHAERGLFWSDGQIQNSIGLFNQLTSQKKHRQVIAFLQLLGKLSETPVMAIGASANYSFSDKKGTKQTRWDMLLRYIDQNYQNELSVPNMADMLSMTPTSFSRYFKQHKGITFTTYLNKVRLGKACEQLLHTDHPVSTIALNLGFNSLSNFNEQFKKTYHTSPTGFRRNS